MGNGFAAGTRRWAIVVVAFVAACLLVGCCICTAQAEARTVTKAGWYAIDGGGDDNGGKPCKVRIDKKKLMVRATVFRTKAKSTSTSSKNKLAGRNFKFKLSKKVRFYDLEVGENRIPAATAREAINSSGKWFGWLHVHVKKGKVVYIGMHG